MYTGCNLEPSTRRCQESDAPPGAPVACSRWACTSGSIWAGRTSSARWSIVAAVLAAETRRTAPPTTGRRAGAGRRARAGDRRAVRRDLSAGLRCPATSTRTGRGVLLPNLPGDWVGRPITGPVGDRLGVAVRPVNDVRALTLAELRLGAGRGASDLVCIALGTGVGGGVVIGGRVHLGPRARRRDRPHDRRSRRSAVRVRQPRLPGPDGGSRCDSRCRRAAPRSPRRPKPPAPATRPAVAAFATAGEHVGRVPGRRDRPAVARAGCRRRRRGGGRRAAARADPRGDPAARVRRAGRRDRRGGGGARPRARAPWAPRCGAPRRPWSCREARRRGGAGRRRARPGRRVGGRRARGGGRARRRRPRGLAVPGFVDLQVNGFAGVNLLTAPPEGYAALGAGLAADRRHGLPPDLHHGRAGELRRALTVRPAAGSPAGSAPNGGPFLSPAWPGAHPPDICARPTLRSSTSCSRPGRSRGDRRAGAAGRARPPGGAGRARHRRADRAHRRRRATAPRRSTAAPAR